MIGCTNKTHGLLLTPLLCCSGTFAQDADQKAALAKANQNPVANMIMVPLEFWHHEGANGTGFTAVAKPVIPASVGGMNLINRFIVPYASISGILQLPDTEFGSPAIGESGLGSNLWSAGPSFLALKMQGNLALGLLAMNVWDFAGSGDGSINKMTLQPILSCQLGDGWYLTSTPAITANWNADSGKKWNVPLGGGFGKLQRFGKLPVDLKIAYYNYVSKPTLGPDWSVLFGVKFLIPTGELRASMQQQ